MRGHAKGEEKLGYKGIQKGIQKGISQGGNQMIYSLVEDRSISLEVAVPGTKLFVEKTCDTFEEGIDQAGDCRHWTFCSSQCSDL